LFAGVGGFRLAFEKSSNVYKTIWANQWEPNRKTQHAYNCYCANFKTNHNCINEDIALVKNNIPEHDILVGGFPCQDYSVANTLAKGIEGKKGVLWWDIKDIIKDKKPKYILLENVDRLIKSPSKQRGRDFGIILKCLNDLDYNVEWRVINAAEYGHPQKRRRIFIFASQKLLNLTMYQYNLYEILYTKGLFAKAFLIHNDVQLLKDNIININNFNSLVELSNKFTYKFENTGIMIDGNIYTRKTIPLYNGINKTLGDILEDNIEEKYFINANIDKWKYLKGSKKKLRYKPNGEQYYYTEGAIPFPDNLNLPARTILTSESNVNRSSHIILDKKTNNYRILTPVECERIQEFPDNWTNTGMPEKYRYFVMGNALVVGVVKTIADEILKLF